MTDTMNLAAYVVKETEKAIGVVWAGDRSKENVGIVYIPRSKIGGNVVEQDSPSYNIKTKEGERVGFPVVVNKVDVEFLRKIKAIS